MWGVAGQVDYAEQDKKGSHDPEKPRGKIL
jgi:hypothetical protein